MTLLKTIGWRNSNIIAIYNSNEDLSVPTYKFAVSLNERFWETYGHNSKLQDQVEKDEGLGDIIDDLEQTEVK